MDSRVDCSLVLAAHASPWRQGAFNAKALLDLYNTDPAVKHLKPYTPIIYESEVRPTRDQFKATGQAREGSCLVVVAVDVVDGAITILLVAPLLLVAVRVVLLLRYARVCDSQWARPFPKAFSLIRWS